VHVPSHFSTRYPQRKAISTQQCDIRK
jgi:hypothetical protein